jgi:hypothetical protein
VGTEKRKGKGEGDYKLEKRNNINFSGNKDLLVLLHKEP